MEWWQWLVLAVPATVFIVSVTMIIRILTSGMRKSSQPESQEVPESQYAHGEETEEGDIEWTRPDPQTVESAGFSDGLTEGDGGGQTRTISARHASAGSVTEESAAPRRLAT